MGNKTFSHNDKKITIKTIAKRAGVSITTVSGVLNNNKKIAVSEKTRKKVLKIANDLNYHPNYIARSLRKKKTNTIGFIVPLLKTGITLSDIEILETLTREKGYNLLIGYSRSNPEIEKNILEEFYYRQVDGIILIPTGKKVKNRFLKKLIDLKFPVVLITKAYGIKTPFVSTDYKKGVVIATEFLIKTGHRRIGFLGGSLDIYSIGERFSGYKKALRDNNIVYDKKLTFIVSNEEDEKVEEKCFDILKENIDGIFISSDRMAIIFIRKAIEKGFKIPDDISVVGFNDSEIIKFSPIPLTTIRQPVEKITRTAFNLLFDIIEKQKRNEKEEKILFEPELVIRNTVKEIKLYFG